MRVVKIVPGSGGTFYCENCMRDGALATALKTVGHDVTLVPMYLPMYTDDPDLTRGSPVFFGGINVYLQQTVPLFRRTPRWVDRLFDSRWLLRAAAQREGSTSADGMGAMTLSMIRGRDGNQAKELKRLIGWLRQEATPDAVHISTVMLIGLARAIREELGLGTLVDAFVQVKQREGLGALKLDVMGGITGGDRAFVDSLRARLEARGMVADAMFREDLDRSARQDFLGGLTVMAVPIPDGEAFGTFMLEAWAAGVPVVQPRAGGFPELIADTGGGCVYPGGGSKALANAIEGVLRDRDRLVTMGEAGYTAVHDRYSVERMARDVGTVYEAVVR